MIRALACALATIAAIAAIGGSDLDARTGPPDLLGIWRFRDTRSPGTGSENGAAAIETADGGFLAIGSSTSAWGRPLTDNLFHLYVLRAARDGRLLWQWTTSRRCQSTGLAAAQASDGGFILGGTAQVVEPRACSGSLMFLIRTAGDGRIVWQKVLGARFDSVTCVRESAAGGFIAGGSALVRLDEDGEVLWMRDDLAGPAFVEAPGGDLVVLGRSRQETILTRVTPGGETIWQTMPGAEIPGTQEIPTAVTLAAGGGFVIAGRMRDDRLVRDRGFVAGTDSGGAVEWVTVLGEDLALSSVTSVVEDAGGGFVAGGQGAENDPQESSAYLARLKPGGAVDWEVIIDRSGLGPLRSLRAAAGGGLLATGASGRALFVARFGPPHQVFRRGDADGSGNIDITDVLLALRFIFSPRDLPEGLGCLDSADADDNGRLNIADAVLLLRFLFAGGPPLPDPAGDCDLDPTPDPLSCARPAGCHE